MGLHGFFGYGAIFQAIAILHFIRRRPDTYWLWIIIFGSGLGAFIYLCVEMLPDIGMVGRSFQWPMSWIGKSGEEPYSMIPGRVQSPRTRGSAP